MRVGTLGRLSGMLLAPAVQLTDLVERGTARLLAACLLGLTGVFALLDFILMNVRSGYLPPVQGYALLFFSYLLSRSRHYRWGAMLATAMFPMVAISMVIAGQLQGFRSLSYALLAPFFAGLFLGVRGAVTLAVLTPIVIGFLPLISALSFTDVLDTVAANVMGGLVAVSYAFHRDWVERRRREQSARHEAELIQLQKMEAIGRMAGGIAHDFNNLLTVIAGAAELLARNSNQRELRLIEAATRSAQDLTEQLLTLSRQKIAVRSTTDLRSVLESTEQLLRRIIGEDIEVHVDVESDLGAVTLGEGQLQQVLLNLATNARDAMPRGRKLSFRAKNHDEGHISLTVTDTGVGMDEPTRARVFEPFFTTKNVGEGTGLGLAIVFGLVNQAGGRVDVESREGRGTTFRLLLPRSSDEMVKVPARSDRRLELGGTARGCILLVEDDASVRELCRSVLRREGYEVLSASKPSEALHAYEETTSVVDLVISDVVMPEMSGLELAERLRDRGLLAPVLFVSGYAPEDAVGRQLDSWQYLPKPFRPTDLLRRVSAILYGLESQSPPPSPESSQSGGPLPAQTSVGESFLPAGTSEIPVSAKVRIFSQAEAGVSETDPSRQPSRRISSEK
jgi:signal transduction histidine kinase/CheY-like chemotaxis protein